MPFDLKQELFLFLLLFFGMSLVAFFILNAGAYTQEILFFLKPSFSKVNPLPDVKAEQILSVPSSLQENALPLLPAKSYLLKIPKVGVSAPVIIPEAEDTQAVLAAMEKGVGLYPDSALPGNNGRSIILGHSSRASWYRGDYAYVFALLSKLETGDEFSITTENSEFRYRVFAKNVLSPEETNRLLADIPADSEIALITCYPIGSASHRTIIQAKQI